MKFRKRDNCYYLSSYNEGKGYVEWIIFYLKWGFEIPKLVYFRKLNRNTKAERLHFCPAFVYALLAVVRFI